MVDLKLIPPKPGIYLMKDKDGLIIYVGKAKNLKKRVTSYFIKNDLDVKTNFLVEKIDSFDFIVTNNEKEAFILENQYIKKYNPHYNINLKDGKTYPRIAIDYNSPYPKIYSTRESSRKRVRYFGPYPSALNTRALVDIGKRFFFLRDCKVFIPPQNELSKKIKACTLYHIKLCYGACIYKETPEEYKIRLKQYISFLQGSSSKTRKMILENIQKLSQNMQFEDASRNVELLNALEEIESQQKIYFDSTKIIDVINFFEDTNRYTFVLLRFNLGKLSYKKILHTTSTLPLLEILLSVLEKIYVNDVLQDEETSDEVALIEEKEFAIKVEADSEVPNDLILPIEHVEELEKEMHEYLPLTSIIGNKSGGKILPLLKMTYENAESEWKNYYKIAQNENALIELKKILNLTGDLYRTETYDISNIGDYFAVGSSVSFFNGMPDKKNYRYFKMKYVTEQNDFKMMQETLLRRFKKSEREDPDLIIIDGGKGQVGAALEVLNAMGKNIPLIGLAKREELIIVPGLQEPIRLAHTSSTLKLLMYTRDEAHRFANKLREKLLLKRVLKSNLNSLTGLGNKRKAIILEKFGTWENVAKSSPEEIQKKTRIPLNVATEIYNALNLNEENTQQKTKE